MLVYGIDFGTTNSSIALYRDGVPHLVPVGLGGANSMRSVVFFPEPEPGRSIIFAPELDQPSIGDLAVHHYVASGMKGRLVQSVKTFLPDRGFDGTVIGYHRYSLEDFVAIILGELKRQADRHFSTEIDAVVLGRPARFSDDPGEEELAVSRLKDAARRAGFKQVELQHEPIAAALTFERTLTDERLVFVADLGGGTSDFTVMRLGPSRTGQTNRVSDILATRGIEVGGDKLDSRLMRSKLLPYFGANLRWRMTSSDNRWFDMPAHYMSIISDWRRIPFLKTRHDRGFISGLVHHSDDPEAGLRLQALIEENLGYALFQAIDQTKCELSEMTETAIFFYESVLQILEPVNRAEFEAAIEVEREQVRQCTLATLDAAGISAPQVDSVFMTGGTSYVPCFRSLMGSIFGHEKVVSGEMITSVVTGLALSAPLFYSEVQ